MLLSNGHAFLSTKLALVVLGADAAEAATGLVATPDGEDEPAEDVGAGLKV